MFAIEQVQSRRRAAPALALVTAAVLLAVSLVALRQSRSHKTVVVVPATTVGITCGETVTTSIVVGNDLTCSSGDGLVVGANNITINLNGHTLTGCGTCNRGVINVGHSGVTVENGSVDAWFGGVFTTGATNRLTGIRVSNSRSNGLNIFGAGTLVSSNVVFKNASDSIKVDGANVKLTSNVVRENAGDGVFITPAATGAVVQTNQSENNTTNGIDDQGVATVMTGNVTNGNGGDGIKSATDATATVGTDTANYNGAYGIEGSPSGKDSGGSLAKGNAQATQCKDVVCS